MRPKSCNGNNESIRWSGWRGWCRYALSLTALQYDRPPCHGALTDIGTEELGHLEIVATIIRQLTKNLTPEEIKASGFDKYYIDHTLAIWPQAASGEPFSASQLQSTGDTITDLYEDMAAEQKARLTYDNILRIVKDPEVAEPIRFLREREIVHFQRFGECLRRTQENLDCRNFYAFNQQIDKKNCGK